MIKSIVQVVSYLSLVVLVMPSVLFLTGTVVSQDQVKHLMLASTIVWFVSAPLWMWNARAD